MGTTSFSGPLHVYGNLEGLPGLVPDPNIDASPSLLFAGFGVPDERFAFLKDLDQGFAGRIEARLSQTEITNVSAIPILHAIANLAAAQATVAATPMTLVTTAALGVVVNMPYMTFAGAIATAAIALDWGFDYCTTTTGGTARTVTVLDSTKYRVGMPIVIARAGAASGNAHLFTNVASLATATTITIVDPALQAITGAPVGTGNMWSPDEFGALKTPTAYAPYIAAGPGLFLDPRQALARGVVVTASGGAGMTVTVRGADVYGQPTTETITVGAGATTNYGKKAYKYIFSATPSATDAGNTYSLGTSDVFGFNIRSDLAEDSEIWWNGALDVATTGWTAADATSPATATTGDVRGTILTSAFGTGSGIGANASNGSLSTITLSGRRLLIRSHLATWNQLNLAAGSQWAYGPTQF